MKLDDKNIGVVLKKVKEIKTYTPADQLLIYPIENALSKTPKNTIEPAVEGNAIYELEEWGAFKIHSSEQLEDRIDFYLAILPKFDELYAEILKPELEGKKGLKSIHLITNSLEPTSAIFLVLDGLFEMPIRFAVKNKDGNSAHIKKLYDLAYPWNVPNKKVDYDRNIMSGINTGLFKRDILANYLKTNKLERLTIVKKSEDGKILALSGEVEVIAGLIQNIVPPQHRYLYTDKR